MTEKRYTQEALELRVPPHSEILNQVAKEVDPATITSPEIQADIGRLFLVAYGRQGDDRYPTLVGLAAPQIGILKRIVLIGMNPVSGGEQPELQAFINPVIIARSEEMVEGRESCYSSSRVSGIVERHKWITLQGYDQFGNQTTPTLEDFPARVGQHELHHLDGIRFPDLITDDNHLHWVEEDEFGDYRQFWKDWPTLCPRSRWEDIKAGRFET
ncbi:MAG TPA: peptide deformylase [Verrucomicrobiae bacterium]|nr:peptide deformylase [Verrucomicrobiae bacterium]